MRCPYCSAEGTRVIDSRPVEDGNGVRRRRGCDSCDNRFTTYERVEVAMVTKRDGRTEPFSPDKVRSGLESALADRPLPKGTIETIVRQVEAVAVGPEPTSTETIGHMVLDGLKAVDDVAYLRFASVYKEFQEASDFEAELARLDD